MLILGLILGCLFTLLVAFLLFAKIRIEIDSNTSELSLKWGYLAKAYLIIEEKDLIIRLRLLFFQKDLYPITYFKQRFAQIRRAKKQDLKSLKRQFRLLRQLASSFRLKVFWVNLDTDDYSWNALLFPIFHFLSKDTCRFQINYEGIVELHLIIENRGIRIIKTLLKGRIQSFYHKKRKNHGNAI